MHCCTTWSANNLGEAISFACSDRINLAREIISSSLIQFPDGSSLRLGKSTLQLETLSVSEALLEFQPMKWEPSPHLRQSSTLLQLRRSYNKTNSTGATQHFLTNHKTSSEQKNQGFFNQRINHWFVIRVCWLKNTDCFVLNLSFSWLKKR